MIPEGHTIEDIKKREQIIRMVSIVETSEHAAKSYLSTLAVLQLDSILTGARIQQKSEHSIKKQE